MNTNKLASEYLKRCKKRFKAVKLLFNEESYADIVGDRRLLNYGEKVY